MNNRHNRALGLLVLLSAAVSIYSRAEAADDPAVLEQTALVVGALECKFPCKDPPAHFHKDFAEWDLEPGESTFKLHKKMFRKRTIRFFDLPWNFWNRMQRPDLHLINDKKDPLSFENFGGPALLAAAAKKEQGAEDAVASKANWPIHIEDFLFAFTIHDLKNTDTPDPTPHAIIYLPIRWDLKIPKQLGDIYFLFVFHIPEKEDECLLEQYTVGQKHCQLLWKLSEKWASGNYTEKGLTEEVRRDYRYFLDHIFEYILSDVPPDTQPSALRNKQISVIMQWVLGILLHNGIIHGNLGGG